MRLRLTKQFDFQMAHALSGYDGKCRNIHGHNYRLFVTVEGEPVSDTDSAKRGMVLDFSELKRIVELHVVEPLDHALLLPADSPFARHLASLPPSERQMLDTKLVTVPFQPTCEHLLLYFAERLEGQFPNGVRLSALRLHETDTSYAELLLD